MTTHILSVIFQVVRLYDDKYRSCVQWNNDCDLHEAERPWCIHRNSIATEKYCSWLFCHMIMAQASTLRTLCLSLHIFTFIFLYTVNTCSEVLMLCESEITQDAFHLFMCFLWWTITQQRTVVIALTQEAAESQLCISAEFYYIIPTSIAAQSFVSGSDMHTGAVFIPFALMQTEIKHMICEDRWI